LLAPRVSAELCKVGLALTWPLVAMAVLALAVFVGVLLSARKMKRALVITGHAHRIFLVALASHKPVGLFPGNSPAEGSRSRRMRALT